MVFAIGIVIDILCHTEEKYAFIIACSFNWLLNEPKTLWIMNNYTLLSETRVHINGMLGLRTSPSDNAMSKKIE